MLIKLSPTIFNSRRQVQSRVCRTGNGLIFLKFIQSFSCFPEFFLLLATVRLPRLDKYLVNLEVAPAQALGPRPERFDIISQQRGIVSGYKTRSPVERLPGLASPARIRPLGLPAAAVGAWADEIFPRDIRRLEACPDVPDQFFAVSSASVPSCLSSSSTAQYLCSIGITSFQAPPLSPGSGRS